MLSNAELTEAESQGVHLEDVAWPEKSSCCLSFLQQHTATCSLLGGVCLALSVTLFVCATLLLLAMLPGSAIVAIGLITLAVLFMIVGILLAWLAHRYQGAPFWRREAKAQFLFSVSLQCQDIANLWERNRDITALPSFLGNEQRTKIRDLKGCSSVCHHVADCLRYGVRQYHIHHLEGEEGTDGADFVGVEAY